MVVSAGDFKRGMTIEMDGHLWQVIEFASSKMAQRANLIKVKVKNIKDGRVLEKTVDADHKFNIARMDAETVQYLYQDGDIFYFMNTTSFEQMPMSKDQVGEAANFLKEGETMNLLTYKEQPMGLSLPTTVALKVVETAPGFRGDTAVAGTKPAKLETGLTVQVPLFVNEGEVIKVDTRDGSYVERVA